MADLPSHSAVPRVLHSRTTRFVSPQICHQCDRENRLLLCDGCDRGYVLDELLNLQCLTKFLLLAVFTVPQVFQSSNLIGQHVIRSQ